MINLKKYRYKFFYKNSENAMVFESQKNEIAFANMTIKNPNNYRVSVYDKNNVMIHYKVRLKDIFGIKKEKEESDIKKLQKKYSYF